MGPVQSQNSNATHMSENRTSSDFGRTQYYNYSFKILLYFPISICKVEKQTFLRLQNSERSNLVNCSANVWQLSQTAKLGFYKILPWPSISMTGDCLS